MDAHSHCQRDTPLTLTLSPAERGNGRATPRARRAFFDLEWCAACGSLRELGKLGAIGIPGMTDAVVVLGLAVEHADQRSW